MSSLKMEVLFFTVFFIYFHSIDGQQNCNGGLNCLNGQCASGYTCNTTTNCCVGSSSFVCQDAATGCSSYQNLCGSENYITLLGKDCRKTCNMCGQNCRDLDSRCAEWKQQGFCTNSWYRQRYAPCLCAVTCGVCNAPCN